MEASSNINVVAFKNTNDCYTLIEDLTKKGAHYKSFSIQLSELMYTISNYKSSMY